MNFTYQSLLETLSSSQIKDLIDEIHLKPDVKFYYAVDPNELKAYAFPFGADKKKEQDCTPEFIADEHLSLHNLFNKKDTKLILLDEYRAEIIGYVKHVYSYSKDNREKVDPFTKAFENVVEKKILSFTEWQNHHKVITECLPFLITYSIGLHSKGLQSLYHLFEKKKLILDEVDLDEDEFPKEFLDVFSDHRSGSLADELFESILPKIVAKYRGKKGRDAMDRDQMEKELEKELASKLRDCAAIDRLISINIDLEERYKRKELEKRHIVLFLSSAGRVEELFNEPALLKYMPIINNNRFNIHRKSAHIFLNLITKRDENDTNTTLRNLEILHSYISMSETRDSKFFYSQTQFEYRQEITQLRETFENYNLLLQYSSFKDDIEKASKGEDAAMNVPLKALMEISKNGKGREKALSEMGEEALIRLKLIEHFIKAREVFQLLKTGVFTSAFGNDHIRGFTHHLPLLFFTENTETNAFIEFISNGYLNSKKLSNEEKSVLLNEIEKRGHYLLARNEDALEPDEWLAILLLFLLLPSDLDDKHRSAKLVLKEVDIMLPILEGKNSYLRTEYCYLGSYAARRIGKFDEAEKLVKKGLKENSVLGKARLKHSYCLIWYSRYKDKLKKDLKKDNDLLKNVISSGEEALKEYEDQKKDDVHLNCLHKQLAALYNTLSYVYCLQFSLGFGNELTKAEIYLSRVKLLEPDYELYPEYLDTEAYMNYAKYKNTNDRVFLDIAKDKIMKVMAMEPLDTEYSLTEAEINQELI